MRQTLLHRGDFRRSFLMTCLCLSFGLLFLLLCGYLVSEVILGFLRGLCRDFNAVLFHENFSILIVTCEVLLASICIPTALAYLTARRLADYQAWVLTVLVCPMSVMMFFLNAELVGGDGGTGTILFLIAMAPMIAYGCRPIIFKSVHDDKIRGMAWVIAVFIGYGGSVGWMLVCFMLVK